MRHPHVVTDSAHAAVQFAALQLFAARATATAVSLPPQSHSVSQNSPMKLPSQAHEPAAQTPSAEPALLVPVLQT